MPHHARVIPASAATRLAALPGLAGGSRAELRERRRAACAAPPRQRRPCYLVVAHSTAPGGAHPNKSQKPSPKQFRCASRQSYRYRPVIDGTAIDASAILLGVAKRRKDWSRKVSQSPHCTRNARLLLAGAVESRVGALRPLSRVPAHSVALRQATSKLHSHGSK